MTSQTQRWIDAGKVLAADPGASVSCPVCGRSDLEVQDIENPKNPREFERYLRCPACSAVNILRMNRDAHP